MRGNSVGQPRRATKRALPGSEALALQANAILFRIMSEHKLLSLGNAATRRSSIRNIHAITLGNLMADTKCRHRLIPFIWETQSLSIRRKPLWHPLSSCHMLDFPCDRREKEFVLDEYMDDAVGHMEKNAEGRLAITRVTLNQRLKVLRRKTTD